ncbi:MAG: Ig-like domain-containing protein [bacterium]|nr:Ig-like domain-containing protein [bacterium]
MIKRRLGVIILGALFCLSIFAIADELLLPGGFSGTVSYSGSSSGAIFLVIFNTPFYGDPTSFVYLPTLGKYTVSNLIPGTYYLAAFIDCNGNHDLDFGHEPLGAYGGFYQPTPITVTSGGNTPNINVTIENPPSGDKTPPTLVSTNPAIGAVNVATTTRTFSFTFSEKMWINHDMEFTNFTANFSYSWSTDGKTITYTSDRNLPANTILYWILQGFQDLAGNVLFPVNGAFATGSNYSVGAVKGTITYLGSSTGRIGIFLSRDKMFDTVVGFGMITAPGQYTVSNLAPGTYYAAAVMDINGNGFPDVGHEPMGMYGGNIYYPTPINVAANATTSNVNITLQNPPTGDSTPPYLVASNPANGAYNVSTTQRTLSFTFSEPMWISSLIDLQGGYTDGITYSWSSDGRTITYTYQYPLPSSNVVRWTLNPNYDDDEWRFMDLAGNILPMTSGSYTTQHIGNIPDIRLNIARSELDLIQLHRYFLGPWGLANWTWSSYTTFANITIDSNAFVDYLTPLQWTPGLDTVTFTAAGYGSDKSVLKYSSYVFNGRLPTALVDNGRKIANCDLKLSDYFLNLGAPVGPAQYSVDTVRYSNSADIGKLTVSFSGDTLKISATSALKGSAQVVVKVYTSTANDWEKELVNVYEIANTYSRFTIASDTSKWFYEIYGDGTGTGTLSWLSSFGSQSGVLRIEQIPGQKAKLTQIITVPEPGWYTAEAKVATDISNPAKQQKAYLYLQELSQNTAIISCANQVIAPGAGGFGSANVWKTMKISYYATGTILGVQVVAINPSNSAVTGSMYIDDIYMYPAPPEVYQCRGVNTIGIYNHSFYDGLNNWLIESYGDATAPGSWDIYNSGSANHWQLLRGIQASGQKAKISQNIDLSNFQGIGQKNAAVSVWVYSEAGSQSNSQKVYLYFYSMNSSRTKVIESGNAILQPGKWTPGEWRQLRFGYTPITGYNSIQLVGINPSGKPTQTMYFDDVEAWIDQDLPAYWDHSLF